MEVSRDDDAQVEVLTVLQVMIYLRRIDLPKEVLGVADENLREYWDEMAKKYPAQVHCSVGK